MKKFIFMIEDVLDDGYLEVDGVSIDANARAYLVKQGDAIEIADIEYAQVAVMFGETAVRLDRDSLGANRLMIKKIEDLLKERALYRANGIADFRWTAMDEE